MSGLGSPTPSDFSEAINLRPDLIAAILGEHVVVDDIQTTTFYNIFSIEL
jgi:hypothetical protein